jgi:hypothetical protein
MTGDAEANAPAKGSKKWRHPGTQELPNLPPLGQQIRGALAPPGKKKPVP